MMSGANRLDFVAVGECLFHFKAGDVSLPRAGHIPLAGDFFGVPLVGHRVEDRLTRQALNQFGECKPILFPSVSINMAKYPLSSAWSVLGTMIFPPSFSTLSRMT